jgi:serine/threonine-protein kinase
LLGREVFEDKSRVQVGRYETVRELGRGGMGIVYEARLAGGGPPVALKVVRRAASPGVHERFQRELRLLASLGRDLGFVPVIDAGASEHGSFLVMPLVTGGTLRERLDGSRLGTARALEIVVAISEAVGRAHERGIVHRDLKPENILFEGDRPLVADLGLAKHFDRR